MPLSKKNQRKTCMLEKQDELKFPESIISFRSYFSCVMTIYALTYFRIKGTKNSQKKFFCQISFWPIYLNEMVGHLQTLFLYLQFYVLHTNHRNLAYIMSHRYNSIVQWIVDVVIWVRFVSCLYCFTRCMKKLNIRPTKWHVQI